MTALLWNAVAWLLAGALLALTLRRVVLLAAALSAPRSLPQIHANLPSVTLLLLSQRGERMSENRRYVAALALAHGQAASAGSAATSGRLGTGRGEIHGDADGFGAEVTELEDRIRGGSWGEITAGSRSAGLQACRRRRGSPEGLRYEQFRCADPIGADYRWPGVGVKGVSTTERFTGARAHVTRAPAR